MNAQKKNEIRQASWDIPTLQKSKLYAKSEQLKYVMKLVAYVKLRKVFQNE